MVLVAVLLLLVVVGAVVAAAAGAVSLGATGFASLHLTSNDGI